MSRVHDTACVSAETFQEIIQERWAEVKKRAEVKRQQDFKMIQEMKSGKGRNPLELLPPEAWQMIFDQLNPEDRANMFHLHPVYRGIMDRTHVSCNLLPQILKLNKVNPLRRDVDDIFDNEDSDDGEDNSNYATLAHSLQNLSKTLKNAVDSVNENDLLELLRRGYMFDRPSKTIMFNYEADEEREMVDSLLNFTVSNLDFAKQFPSRSICTESTCPEMHLDLKRKLTCYLKHAGSLIWHFKFHIEYYETPCNLSSIYVTLLRWLSLMPNLKWLQLSIHCEIQSNRLDVLPVASVPPLKNLERLDLSFSSDQCPPIAEEMCKNLIVAYPKIIHLNLYKTSPTVLPLTTSLHLKTFSSCITPTLFQELNNVDWALKRIRIWNLDDRKSISINSLFGFLQRFPTLETVVLDVKSSNEFRDFGYLQLPNLREFDVVIHAKRCDFEYESFGLFVSLQFLLYCKNLKEIKFTAKVHNPPSFRGPGSSYQIRWDDFVERMKLRDNMINFRGSSDFDISESNIWKVFPYLEHVKIVIKMYKSAVFPEVNTLRYRNRVSKNDM